jgi:hypothetical protein
LVCIVRAHEVQESGYKQHFDPLFLAERLKDIINKFDYRRKLKNPRITSSIRMMFTPCDGPDREGDDSGNGSGDDDSSNGGHETPASLLTSHTPSFGKLKNDNSSSGSNGLWYHPSDDIPNGIVVHVIIAVVTYH